MPTTMLSRWSQIAAHIPGRTDNEIKNYWNAYIKKKSKSKHHSSSPSAQAYMETVPEGYQTTNNTVNLVTTGETQLGVPGILELKRNQVQDQNDLTNQPISSFQMRINDTSTHTHETAVSCRAGFPGSAGIPIPAVLEPECLKDKIENDGWCSTHSYSNADEWSHILEPGAYSNNEAGISIEEDYESLYDETSLQSCPPLSLHSQFSGPAIKWPADLPNNFQGEDGCRDHVNLRNDVSLGISNYTDIYSRQKSYQLPQIDGRGGVSDQLDCSIIPREETNATPIPILGSNGPFELQGEIGSDQVKVSELDDTWQVTVSELDVLCTLNAAAIFHLDQNLF